jgi:hypothetical protein
MFHPAPNKNGAQHHLPLPSTTFSVSPSVGETGPPPGRKQSALKRWSILLTAAVTATLIVGVGVPAQADQMTPVYHSDRAVANDSMNKISASGWPSAEVGGGYNYSNPESFSESASGAVVALPASGVSRTAGLASTSATNSGGVFSALFPEIPTVGNGVSAGIQLRHNGNNYYQASIRVAPGGVSTLSIDRIVGSTTTQVTLATTTLPFTVSANMPVSVEFQVVGNGPVIVSARAWPATGTAPDWQLAAADSSDQRLETGGSVALWSYISRSSNPTSVVFTSLTADSLIANDGEQPTPTATPTATPTVTPTAAPTVTPTAAPTPTSAPTATAAPTPAPTVPPVTTPPASPTSPAGTRASAGAAAIGSTHYAVPSDAIFVSPQGSTFGPGTISSPFRTLGAAVASSANGTTIVMRAGTYHESVTLSSKRLTIQSYPGEAVWLDGSSVVSNWVQQGSNWVATGWTTQFDSSPTYTRGSGDSGGNNWQFVNPAYPMAAHPDQVWVGSTAQQQVASAAQVTAGKFAVDYSAHTITLGTNPFSSTVRASDLVRALSIRSAGTIIRGIGIAHYAPSVPDMGAVTAERNDITLENVAITDSATTGLYVIGAHNTLRNVSAVRSGLMGVGAANADGLMVDGLLASNNNTEHFNNAPASGGFKLTRMLGVTVKNSVFANNSGPGLWFDESVGDIIVTGSDILNNAGHGLITELSANVVIANNIVAGNRDNGMKINDTSNVSIWNNTLTGNGRSINIVEDTRRASNLSTPGHDPRNPKNPLFTWINGPVTVNNNIIANTTGGNTCLLCVEDYSHQFSAAQMGVTAQGNVYQRNSASAPAWDVIWSTGAGNPKVFATVGSFTSGTGQESNGTDIVGTPALSDSFAPLGAAASASGKAVGLSSTIASLIGRDTGSKNAGAWIN